MEAIENAKDLWNNPQDLINAWQEMPDKVSRENLIIELIIDSDIHSIVDLGCGNGRLFELMKYQQYEYVGYDSSLPMILEAKESYPKDVDRFSVVDTLNFQSGMHYDVVVCQDVAQHYRDPITFIRTILDNWSAKHYIFSLLIGDKKEDLYNSTVIPLSEFLVFLRDTVMMRPHGIVYTHIEPFDDTKFSWFLVGLFSKD